VDDNQALFNAIALSYSTKSMRGDQFRAYMLAVVKTCKRQGISALETLRKTCHQGLTGQAITTSVFAERALLEGCTVT